MNIGAGAYANFLGVNLWGAIICWAAYIVPGLISQANDKKNGIEPTWRGRSKEEIARLDAERAKGGCDEVLSDADELAPTGA